MDNFYEKLTEEISRQREARRKSFKYDLHASYTAKDYENLSLSFRTPTAEESHDLANIYEREYARRRKQSLQSNVFLGIALGIIGITTFAMPGGMRLLELFWLYCLRPYLPIIILLIIGIAALIYYAKREQKNRLELARQGGFHLGRVQFSDKYYRHVTTRGPQLPYNLYYVVVKDDAGAERKLETGETQYNRISHNSEMYLVRPYEGRGLWNKWDLYVTEGVNDLYYYGADVPLDWK